MLWGTNQTPVGMTRRHFMRHAAGASALMGSSLAMGHSLRVYADEMNPLDFYRTVLRIDDGRHQVFEGIGGSLLVLSPIGSKVLAIGGMMAAIERDLPVMYVEALSYSTELGDQDETITDADLVVIAQEVVRRA